MKFEKNSGNGSEKNIYSNFPRKVSIQGFKMKFAFLYFRFARGRRSIPSSNPITADQFASALAAAQSALGGVPGSSPGNVTRLSTIVEILIILILNFY